MNSEKTTFNDLFTDIKEEQRKTYISLIIGHSRDFCEAVDKCDKVFGDMRETDLEEYRALIKTVGDLTMKKNYKNEEQREFRDWRL